MRAQSRRLTDTRSRNWRLHMSVAPKTRYDGVAMIIHWLTAVLMIFMVFFGEDLMESGETGRRGGRCRQRHLRALDPRLHRRSPSCCSRCCASSGALTHHGAAYPASMKRYEVIGSEGAPRPVLPADDRPAAHRLAGLRRVASGAGSSGHGAAVRGSSAPIARLPLAPDSRRAALKRSIHEIGSNVAMVLAGTSHRAGRPQAPVHRPATAIMAPHAAASRKALNCRLP